MSITEPDSTLEFLPLYADQTEEVILQRLRDWANEGLDPVADAGAWVDTREGSHWFNPMSLAAREFARLYDFAGSEVPMSGFVIWAWGSYLDDLAAVWDVHRIPAQPAVGSLTFVGGTPGDVITAGSREAAVPAAEDDPAPTFLTLVDGTFAGDGTVIVAIEAEDPGAAGNVAANAITAPVTPLPDGVTFMNTVATSGGEEVETDDALRTRVLQATAGKGPGAVRDYVRWAMEYGGVGHVEVVPLWDGPGTVLVVVSDPNGLPLAGAIVDGFQAELDPVAGQGHGTAPIGATATVATPVGLTIDISAHLTFELGYSWDGAANTMAVGPAIEQRLRDYFLSIPPGGEVVIAQAAGIFTTYPGVHDLTGFQLNGAAVNVNVGLSPPQQPELGTITFT